jgi:exoribonuclease R
LKLAQFFQGERVHALKVERKNRAKELIQDFMIAANGVTARYLSEQKISIHPPGG